MEFKVGDIVWLKSGGPAMTVEVVHSGSGEVRCAWFGEVAGARQLLKHVFRFESLTTSEPVSPPSRADPGSDGYKVYEEGDD